MTDARNWIPQHRGTLGVAAIVVVVLSGAGYLASVSLHQRADAAVSAAPERGNLLFIDLSDGRDRVQHIPLAAPDGARTTTPRRCQRVYTVSGTTVCLRLAGPGLAGVAPSFEAAILDGAGRELRTVALPGIPSRNYWGVTVGSDDRTFYATMASGTRIWLVRGDLRARTVQTVRTGAECPSLSPDGRALAYKKRTKRLGPWQLAVLDLDTGVERPLSGTEGVDDQATWLDADHLLYGRVPRSGAKPSLYSVRIDGSSPPRLLISDAASPVPVQ